MRSTRKGSLNERFAARFTVNPATGCWDWIGAKNTKGYGVIGGLLNGKRYAPVGQNILAHRASWVLHVGDIPDGEGAHGTVVMHRCDNPSCVNPAHLVLGSQADNVQDMDAKQRRKTKALAGIEHWKSAFSSQADIDYICSQVGRSQELAKQFGVSVSTIKYLRKRNGAGSNTPEKFTPKPMSQEIIDHIRSTPDGTRGLTKLYGLSKTTISRIRKGLTHKER